MGLAPPAGEFRVLQRMGGGGVGDFLFLFFFPPLEPLCHFHPRHPEVFSLTELRTDSDSSPVAGPFPSPAFCSGLEGL